MLNKNITDLLNVHESCETYEVYSKILQISQSKEKHLIMHIQELARENQ